jgi:hypothetical protein
MKEKKRKSVKRFFEIAAFMAAIISAIVALIELKIQKQNTTTDKYVMYEQFTEQIKTLEITISNLRDRIFLLEDQLQHHRSKSDIKDFKVLYGKIISTNDIPIPDVKIEVLGGSQVFSNSNGEFLINCRARQRVRFGKNGYKSYEIVASEEHFKQYQRIVLKGGRS